MREFELIREHFQQGFPQCDDVIVGIGDDAALSRLPAGEVLVSAVDTLVENVHFLPDAAAADIAYKAVAVNLSDFAAMGATPRWMTLALTCPTADEQWLSDFASGLQMSV